MDFWLAETIIALAGMGMVTILPIFIVRAVVNSPMKRARAEIMKKQAFSQIRDERVDIEIAERLKGVEQLVSIQNDEIRKLTEENEFFRRLLSDKAESGGKG